MDKVVEALDEIRPFLNADGGDLSVVEITDENIYENTVNSRLKTNHD